MEATASKTEQAPAVDLLTGSGSVAPPHPAAPQQPSLGDDPQKAVKATILSLYQQRAPSQGYQVSCLCCSHLDWRWVFTDMYIYLQAYSAHGYPVNPYLYQQQQAAAMRMAQQQQQQQLALAQVREVR